MPPGAWQARYEDAFALHLNLSECEYLVGGFERADQLHGLLLENARSDLDRARVYQSRIRLYQVGGRYSEAVTAALDALRLFGVTFPGSDDEAQAATRSDIQEIAIALRGRRAADLADAPAVTDPDVRMIISLLVDPISAAYVTGSVYYPLLATKAVKLSVLYGNQAESIEAYSSYATLLLSVIGDIPLAFEFSALSMRLVEKLDEPGLRGKVLMIHGSMINHWRRHVATSLPFLERSFSACLEVGDLVFAGFSAYQTTWTVVERGDTLDEVLKVAGKFAAFARQSHNDAVLETIRMERQFAACLKGLTRGPTSFDDDAFDEAACLAAIAGAAFGCGVAFHHIMKQIAAFTYGRYAEARQAAAQAAAALGPVTAMPIQAAHHFFLALTLAELYAQAPAAEQRETAQTLEGLLRKHAIWAAHCPENFQSRHALVSAEVARIEGRDLDAMRLYQEAIRSARENGFVQHEALAYELASRFYRARGFDEIADTYLREARSRYARWGADGKVRQLDQRHPQLVEPRLLAPTATLTVATVQLDLYSVAKASQSISARSSSTSWCAGCSRSCSNRAAHRGPASSCVGARASRSKRRRPSKRERR